MSSLIINTNGHHNGHNGVSSPRKKVISRIHIYLLHKGYPDLLTKAPGTPGHHRTPSMDFKEMTRRDAESSLAMELDKLARTGTEARRELMDREFDGFKKLFGKFINESGPSVIWDNIERLPQNAVSISLLLTLKVASSSFAIYNH